MVDFLRQDFPFDKNINEHNMIIFIFTNQYLCINWVTSPLTSHLQIMNCILNVHIYIYSLCTWINLQDAADGDLFLMDQQVPWTKVFRWSSNVRFLRKIYSLWYPPTVDRSNPVALGMVKTL